MGSPRSAGPLRQATGVPRSGAGVVVGILRGAGNSLMWKQKVQFSCLCLIWDFCFILSFVLYLSLSVPFHFILYFIIQLL